MAQRDGSRGERFGGREEELRTFDDRRVTRSQAQHLERVRELDRMLARIYDQLFVPGRGATVGLERIRTPYPPLPEGLVATEEALAQYEWWARLYAILQDDQ